MVSETPDEQVVAFLLISNLNLNHHLLIFPWPIFHILLDPTSFDNHLVSKKQKEIQGIIILFYIYTGKKTQIYKNIEEIYLYTHNEIIVTHI